MTRKLHNTVLISKQRKSYIVKSCSMACFNPNFVTMLACIYSLFNSSIFRAKLQARSVDWIGKYHKYSDLSVIPIIHILRTSYTFD